jgi:hypothetical protein
LLEEFVSLVIHQDEAAENFHFDLPDRFTPKSGKSMHIDLLDVLFSPAPRGRAADGAEVEPPYFCRHRLPAAKRLPLAIMIMLAPLLCNRST